MKTVLFIFLVLILLSVALIVWLRFKDRQKHVEPLSSSEPTDTKDDVESPVVQTDNKPDPVHPIKDLTPIYKVGDKITDGKTTATIVEVRKVCYVLDDGQYIPLPEQDKWTLITEPEPQPAFNLDAYTSDMVSKFSSVVKVDKDTTTYLYIRSLIHEARWQFCGDSIVLLNLYHKELFPSIIDYFGKEKNEQLAFDSMCGWIIALVLTELCPDKRNELMKIGYNLGASKDTYIYKYEFHSDPNVARIIGSAIVSAVKGKNKPDMDEMRKEVGGRKLSVSIHNLANGYGKYRDSIFVDVSKFFPTAPGPYLDAYKDRSSVGGVPYPDAEKNKDLNLKEDKAVYDEICKHYNLGDETYNQHTVQAIADKEAAAAHIVGDSKTVGSYYFRPAFGVFNIGVTIPVYSTIGKNIYDIGMIGSLCRKFLLEGNFYGRRRPGQTEVDGVAYDGAAGVLVNFDIENNDGNPCGYYDKNGNYIYGYEAKPGEYDYASRHNVYANSYPSGHSAYIASAAMFLMEVYPQKADLILKAMNEFATNRQVARYHWLSDTIIGRTIGAMMSPIIRAASDYDKIIEQAKKEFNNQ